MLCLVELPSSCLDLLSLPTQVTLEVSLFPTEDLSMLSSAFLLLEVLEVLVALELEVLLLPTVLELVPEATVPDLLVVDPVLTLTSMLEVLVPVLEVLVPVSAVLEVSEELEASAALVPEVLEALAVLVLEALAVLEVPEALEVPVV